MENRALRTISRALGSALFGFSLILAGANAYAAEGPVAECSSCHDQAQKLEKSAHAGLPCDTCHESHDQYPHPANIPKPQCTTCHQHYHRQYQHLHGVQLFQSRHTG